MKRITLLFILFLTSPFAYADNTLLVDRYFSPYAGSADLLAAQHLMIQGEDYLLKAKEDQPNSGWKIAGRTLEQLLFWYNIGNLVAVTEHEVFGHGYRLRELGYTPASYSLSPWGGSTGFYVNNSISAGKYTAITVAGLEAEAVMAHDLKMGWLRDGKIDGRMATTYTQSAQSLFWYTLTTHLGKTKTDGIASNDVSSYIYQLNATYPNYHYSHSKLMRLAYYNLIDPMTFYAYYSFFYYMGTGESWRFPLIPITKTVRYLPNIRIGYAPYAPEAYFENYLMINEEPLYVYAKGSRRSYGGGAEYDNLWTYSKGNIGLKFDFWNQNQYLTSVTLNTLETTGSAYSPQLKQRLWGAALSFNGTMKLSPQTKLYAELGAKSAGYLPGYSLGGEMVARIGLRF